MAADPNFKLIAVYLFITLFIQHGAYYVLKPAFYIDKYTCCVDALRTFSPTS